MLVNVYSHMESKVAFMNRFHLTLYYTGASVFFITIYISLDLTYCFEDDSTDWKYIVYRMMISEKR